MALVDFLIAMANPRIGDQFRRDPEATMEQAGLTEEDKKAIRSGDDSAIRHRLGFEALPAARQSNHRRKDTPGRLVVVGSGISIGQLTSEAKGWIEYADKVLYAVQDVASERYIQHLNASAESLAVFYGDDKERSITYLEMTERILECVRDGLNVCAVFYGHPGMFVFPSREAIRRAREEGYEASMLPGVSSLDCLLADFNIDFARGCQIFEATDLLVNRRMIDTSATVIVLQIGGVGCSTFRWKGFHPQRLPDFLEVLVSIYGTGHEGYLYHAPYFVVSNPAIKRIKLFQITRDLVNASSTLVIPPRA